MRDSNFASEKNNSRHFKKRDVGGSICEGVPLRALPIPSLFFLFLVPGCYSSSRPSRTRGCGAARVDQAGGREFTRDPRVPEPTVAAQAPSVYSRKRMNDCQEFLIDDCLTRNHSLPVFKSSINIINQHFLSLHQPRIALPFIPDGSEWAVAGDDSGVVGQPEHGAVQ